MAEQDTNKPKNSFFGSKGTSRKTRLLAALAPSHVQIEDRDMAELIRMSRRFAQTLQFYNLDDVEDGNWTPFLEGDEEEMIRYLQDSSAFATKPSKQARYSKPHLALFLTFLELLQFPRKQMNQLTARHLEFYFKEILGLQKRPPQPHRVHVTFELSEGFSEYRLPQGSALDAGENDQGEAIVYRTDEELVVNRASIAVLKSVHKTPQGLFAAEDARLVVADENSSSSANWKPFGSTPTDITDPNSPLSFARLGVAIASPKMAFSKQNDRYVHLRFTIKSLSEQRTIVDFESLRFFASTRNKMVPIDRDVHFHPRFILSTGYTEVGGSYNPTSQLVKAATDIDSGDIGKLLIIDHHVVWIREIDGTDIKVQPFFTLKRLLLEEGDAIYDEDNKTITRTNRQLRSFSATDTGKLLIMGTQRFWIEQVLADDQVQARPLHSVFSKGNPIKLTYSYLEIILDIVLDLSAAVPAIEPLASATASDYSPNTPFHHVDSSFPCLQILKPTKPDVEEAGLISELSFRNLQINLLTPRVIQKGEPLTDKDGNTSLAVADLTLFDSFNNPINILSERTDELEIYQLHPFGYQILSPLPEEIPFAPTYDQEGELYIGIQGLQPPQSLNLLFQMAEGSANSNIISQGLNWGYLNREWWTTPGIDDKRKSKKLPPLLLKDDTAGFMKSGIMIFSLSAEARTDNPLLPRDYLWLRAKVQSGTAGLSDVISIYPQAVAASFQPNSDEASSNPLAAEAIGGLIDYIPAIESVFQPYPSLVTAPAEIDLLFYSRASERIRHKNRALTTWDYERLVLERFPEVFKVKCLPAPIRIDGGTAEAPQQEPGLVEIIVVPNVLGEKNFGAFEPRLPNDLLLEIEQYLSQLSSPFTVIKVYNPIYEKVQLTLDVRFKAGFDPGFYTKVLNEKIIQFLSPWVEDKNAEIEFDRTIYANTFVNLIDEQPYIDFVANLYLAVISGNKVVTKPSLKAQHPNTVWVTSSSHDISVLETDEIPDGIGHMKITVSFEVNKP